MMSSPEKMIRRFFLEAGLSNVQKQLRFFFFFFFYIYEAYLYGTVNFVMLTLIDFNRSQHALHLRGPLMPHQLKVENVHPEIKR